MIFSRSSAFYLSLTFVTGAAGLCYQVIWQRYLTMLIGADARSTSLVIALFLLGLALGNYFFGQFAQSKSRKKSLQIYGQCELAIGLWALIFPLLLNFIHSVLIKFQPIFIVDLLASALLILPATFLMGSTVPLLTGALPEGHKEVNDIHRKIYAINTLGAFLGVLIGSFYLIPEFGLSFGSNLVGLINILIGLFYISNNFSGEVIKTEDPPIIPHRFTNNQVYFFVFVTGAFAIALEIFMIRLWALALGPSVVVFPFVLSLFILGLSLGPLTMKEVTVESTRNEIIKVALASLWSIGLACYFPLWVGNLRVLIEHNDWGFYLYHFVNYLLMALMILPMLIPLGRLLPMGYSFLKKEGNNFAIVCGRLYTSNTAGTFFGALVLGHFIFYFVNIDLAYKISIFVLLSVFVFFLGMHKKYVSLGFVSLVLVVSVLWPWHRNLHYISLFRKVEPVTGVHLTGPFSLPSLGSQDIVPYFLKDDIHNTVSVFWIF